MAKIKTALVLEGGGMRGAYTTGALTWLLDNNIEFDDVYGISTGAVHLCNYLLKDKENLKKFSTEYVLDENAVGIRSFFRCGRIVDYDYLFNEIICKRTSFDIDLLHNSKVEGHVGLYELEKGGTYYTSTRNISINELKAACSLPIIGKVVKEKGRHILDGGITEMIPVNEAIKDKCDKFLIITTKPIDYKRKASKKIVVTAMKMFYPKWPCVGNDYAIRDKNYYKQIGVVRTLEQDGKALYCYPTEKSNVTRLGGSKQELCDLFDLGYNDMESRKEQIYKLLQC